MAWLEAITRPRVGALSPLDERVWSASDSWAGTTAGVPVGTDSSLKASAVWAAVRLLSESAGVLPAILYERLEGEAKERATEEPLYDVLHNRPNRWQTPFEYRAQKMVNLLLRGNAFSQIVPGERGAVDQLVPIHPDRVTVEQLADRSRRYRIHQDGGGERIVLAEDMHHDMGLSLDGLVGVSVITYARETIGLSLAAQQHGARMFGQGTRLSGIVKYPGTMSNDAKRRYRQSWQESHAGGANAYTVAVLDEGMDWVATGMTNEDAQFLSTREFQVEDIARWFNVPLHMIQHTSKATSWGSGIAELSLGFVTYSLLPWLRRMEQAITRDLILDPQRFFCEFLVDGLLRGDLKSRYDAYATGRQWGWLSADDVRRIENMNPIGPDGGGDVYLAPVNMVPADQLRDTVEAKLQPPPPPAGGGGSGGNGAPPAGLLPALETQRASLALFAQDAAARVVRKETTVLAKAARRCAADPEAWRAAVRDFYAEHGPFVAAALHVAPGTAAEYGDRRSALVARNGMAWLRDSEERAANELAALALEALGGLHDLEALEGVGNGE